MTMDRRTKAELLSTLAELEQLHQKLKLDMDGVKLALRKARSDIDATKIKSDQYERILVQITDAITVMVLLRYPKTLAFGGVETTWYEGQEVHPGYEGDNEEVRLLRFLHDLCKIDGVK